MMLQIGVDAIILVLFAAVLIFRRPRISKKDEAVVRSLENIVEETKKISKDFEVNLERRQELLQQITLKLDQRIQIAQNLCNRLDQISQTAEVAVQNLESSSTAGQRPQNADQQKVLSLAQKGLNAAEIAKNVRRPVGEVELILGLKKIAS